MIEGLDVHHQRFVQARLVGRQAGCHIDKAGIAEGAGQGGDFVGVQDLACFEGGQNPGGGLGLAGKLPGIGLVGGGQRDGLRFLHLEKVLVQPLAGFGVQAVEGIGDGEEFARIGVERNVAAIGEALVAELHGRGAVGFLGVLFAQEERLEHLALGVLEFDQDA